MNEFNDWLVANGFDPEAITDDQKPALQAAWRASLKAPDPPAPISNPDPPAPMTNPGVATMEEILAAQRRENDRVARIVEMVATAVRDNPSQVDALEKIGQEALRSDGREGRPLVTVEQAQLYLLRVTRGFATTLHVPSQPQVNAAVLEAAVCKAGDLKDLDQAYPDRVLDAVDRNFKGGIGLHELIHVCAQANGFRGHPSRDLRRAMRFAFREPDDGMQASVPGPSNLSISGILSNVANKFVREAFMFVEQAWRRITAVRPVKDFKQITTYSLTGDLTYKEIPPGGELKHGTLGDEEYTNQAKSYGLILGIDRRDIINDDLGALTSVNRRMGRGGALKINQVFWTEFLDNATFFTAARGNYDDGTDTVFGNDGLVAADVIWNAMTDPDGQPMGHMAKILLVPPGLRIAALRLMNSQQILANGEEGDANPWSGQYEVVSSRYMANSAYTGYSALAWFLLCDPNDIPVIETCFLNGNEMPTVETVEMAADHLGMAVRAYHDFGCRKQEYRGGLKLKGEA